MLCQIKDSQADSVYPSRTVVWGNPPNPMTRKTAGSVCYVCMRVYSARFKQKYRSIQKTVEAPASASTDSQTRDLLDI